MYKGASGKMSEVRVRFAPSPTGYLHVGGARTCLFNWLFAKNNNGKLVLRIEDTDLDRLKDDSIRQITDSLRWLGLDWDEGPEKGGPNSPYFQSQRLGIYENEARRLIDEGKAYYCFCTPEELDVQRQEAVKEKTTYRYNSRCRDLREGDIERFIREGRKPVIRLKVPYEGETVVDDMIRGRVSFDNALIDDFIIVKSNNIAAYNFACVVDDHKMGITHVIRAEEHLSNTPKQLLLSKALGYTPPAYAHVPMILAPDRSKLSKRHGAASVEEFRDMGILPEAMINYLTLLGWSSGGQEEIMSIDESVKNFSLERVSKNASVYDVKKLIWINGHYIRSYDLDRLTEAIKPFYIKNGLIDEKTDEKIYGKLKRVVDLEREKAWTLQEIVDASPYFFKDVEGYEEKGVEKFFKKEGCIELLQGALEKIKPIEPFIAADIEPVYRAYAEETGLKAGDVIHPTRLALTGRTVSRGIFDVMEILGKEECIKRINCAIKYIEGNL
jgi:glutamyl-tRNA synthetase